MKRRAALLPRVQRLVETNNIPLPPRALPGVGGTAPSHLHCLLRGAHLPFYGRSQDTCLPWRDQDLSAHCGQQTGFFPPHFLTFILSLCFEAGAGLALAVLQPGQGRAVQPVGVTAAPTAGRSRCAAAPWLAENTPRTLPRPVIQRVLSVYSNLSLPASCCLLQCYLRW